MIFIPGLLEHIAWCIVGCLCDLFSPFSLYSISTFHFTSLYLLVFNKQRVWSFSWYLVFLEKNNTRLSAQEQLLLLLQPLIYHFLHTYSSSLGHFQYLLLSMVVWNWCFFSAGTDQETMYTLGTLLVCHRALLIFWIAIFKHTAHFF